MRIGAVLLAGGRGSRMGEGPPKPLRMLAGKTLIARVLDRLDPGLFPIVINANDEGPYAHLGLPIVTDRRAGFAGPLAGIEAGLLWHAAQPDPVRHVLVAAADMPFLPTDLARRLSHHADAASIAVSQHRDRLHPTASLWPLALAGALSAWLDATDRRAVLAFMDAAGFATCEFPKGEDGGLDPFLNLNTPQDLAAAERRFLGTTE